MRLLRCCSRFYPVIPAKAGIQKVENGVYAPRVPPRFRTLTAARVNVNAPQSSRPSRLRAIASIFLPQPALISSATRSPIIIVVTFVLARMQSGMMEASATRKPSSP